MIFIIVDEVHVAPHSGWISTITGTTSTSRIEEGTVVPTAKVDAGVSAKKRVANNGGPHLTQLMAVCGIAPPGHRFAKESGMPSESSTCPEWRRG
jgi:hypothetical protein